MVVTSAAPVTGVDPTRVEARERILDAAYDLFSHRGVYQIGVNEVIARSEVAKATFYRYFPSKTDLVLAFLEEREQRWTRDFLEAESARRGTTPEQQLLAIFDMYDEWFHRPDFEGCSFVNVLLEMHGHGPEHPLGRASIQCLSNIRAIVRDRAEQAGLHQPEVFARSWYILMKGSIVAAAEGDADAARRALPMARGLIGQHRNPTPAQ